MDSYTMNPVRSFEKGDFETLYYARYTWNLKIWAFERLRVGVKLFQIPFYN